MQYTLSEDNRKHNETYKSCIAVFRQRKNREKTYMKRLAAFFAVCVLIQFNINADQYYENDKVSFSYPDEAKIDANEGALVYMLQCKDSHVMISVLPTQGYEAMLKPMADMMVVSMKEQMTKTGNFKNVKVVQSGLLEIKDKKGYKITTVVNTEPSLEIKTVNYIMLVDDKIINFMITKKADEIKEEEYIKVIESFKFKQ